MKPFHDLHKRIKQENVSDMNLRDYFAAKVMQGLYTDPNMCMPKAKAAEWCYEIADAMMEARQ
jgi:hypothetical protein